MNVGVIGCGAIARRAHLPAIKSLNNINLYAVADIKEKTAKRIAKKFNARKFYTDYKELLCDKAVDMVIICTPTPFHGKMIIDSANSGKNILVEKPMTLTVKEAINSLKAVKKNNVKLCVVQNYRYLPSIRKAKLAINRGELGNIVSMIGRANTKIPLHWTTSKWLYHEGGALDDFGPHLIDAICWLNDHPPTKVIAFGGDFLNTMNMVNYSQILIEFENRTIAVANITWLTTSDFDLYINGTGGSISLDLRFDYFIKYHDFMDPIKEGKNLYRKISKTTRKVISGEIFYGSLIYYKNIIQDFVNSIEKGAKIPVTGEEALKVISILEAAKNSIRKNSVVYINELIN